MIFVLNNQPGGMCSIFGLPILYYYCSTNRKSPFEVTLQMSNSIINNEFQIDRARPCHTIPIMYC